ncbi:MAG: hypothetical protein ACYTEQ_16930 [Planctomycetota bacterium]|jgi:hypothetical protein
MASRTLGSALGGPPTLNPVAITGADQLYPLGYEYVEEAIAGTVANNEAADAGDKVWIYVQNVEGSALAQGDIVVREDGEVDYQVVQSNTDPTIQIVGVAQHAIADTEFGFVQRRGLAEVKGDGGVTVDTAVIDGGTGQATNAAAGNHTFGWATEDDGAAGSLFTAYINCQG